VGTSRSHSSGRAQAARERPTARLVVKQMRGEYRVKNAGLRPLFLEASHFADS